MQIHTYYKIFYCESPVAKKISALMSLMLFSAPLFVFLLCAKANVFGLQL